MAERPEIPLGTEHFGTRDPNFQGLELPQATAASDYRSYTTTSQVCHHKCICLACNLLPFLNICRVPPVLVYSQANPESERAAKRNPGWEQWSSRPEGRRVHGLSVSCQSSAIGSLPPFCLRVAGGLDGTHSCRGSRAWNLTDQTWGLCGNLRNSNHTGRHHHV